MKSWIPPKLTGSSTAEDQDLDFGEIDKSLFVSMIGDAKVTDEILKGDIFSLHMYPTYKVSFQSKATLVYVRGIAGDPRTLKRLKLRFWLRTYDWFAHISTFWPPYLLFSFLVPFAVSTLFNSKTPAGGASNASLGTPPKK